MKKVHNFSAGPGILPQSALDNSISAIQNFAGLDLSLLEISHRSKEYVAVMDEARKLPLEILGLDDSYECIYLQGGASLQFCMIPFNFLNNRAGYLKTGTWASNAVKEAGFFGETVTVASSEDKNFTYIPKDYVIPSGLDYFHYTSNNTIYGTQMKSIPECDAPLICDMSSDIFSKRIDASKFDMIYAGAQKNMGPAGATLVIIKKEMLEKISKKVPSMLDYRVHSKKESMFNTPPVFSVYCALQVLKWIQSVGLEEMERRNFAKQELLYNEIDTNEFFVGNTAVEDRSWMNATFVMKDDSMTDKFLSMCKDANISGIKGHRSAGGFRASMYNALPLESVQALVDVMKNFKP
ncbi:MAG: 3-phosphoserine/phosphohydroxythreonine transaminase [Flavobacteriales bacterium]|nr:3-phosphoserine/phosphohydroxythreonine transaminase [Flavobacteriales bacterium]